MSPDEIKKKFADKITEISQELAQELLSSDSELEKRFTTLDADVQEILINVGNNTMRIVGESLEDRVKKKLPKQE